MDSAKIKPRLVNSTPLPLRLAFFCKSRRALDRILAGENGLSECVLVRPGLIITPVAGRLDDGFAHLDGHRAILGDSLGQ